MLWRAERPFPPTHAPTQRSFWNGTEGRFVRSQGLHPRIIHHGRARGCPYLGTGPRQYEIKNAQDI